MAKYPEKRNSGENLNGQLDDDDDDKVALARSITLFGSVGVLLGCIVGTAIFLSPQAILRGVDGSVGWSLVIWLASAILGSMEALSFAELGSSISKSGGEYVYLKCSFGPLIAFLRVWTNVVIISPAMTALQTMVISTYVITPFLGDCQEPPYHAVRLVAACAMWLILYINCASVPWTIRIQSFLTISKIFGLLILIMLGAYLLIRGNVDNFKDPFHHDHFRLGGLSTAFMAGRYAFGGWTIINNITEEIKQPKKTLPRAIFITLFVVFVMYMLVNVAYLTAMTPEEMLASDAVAVIFAERTMGNWSWIVWVSVALSSAGQINGALLSRARMSFVASREGALPEVLSLVHIKRRTPLPAATIFIPFAVVMLWLGDIYSLLNYIVCIDTAFTILSVCSIFYFRRKLPDLQRPFKVCLLVPCIFIFVNTIIVALAFYDSPVEATLGLVTTVIGVPFYWFSLWKNRPHRIQLAIDKIYIFLQKITLSVKQEVKTY